MSSLPFVSVIVPTFRRSEILCQTLLYILQQDYPSFELIIVDQTPQQPPSVRRRMAELGQEFDNLAYIHLSNPGLTGARNTGISHAKGSVLLFADDDVVPGDRWIAAHARNYDDPQVGGVVGRVVEPVQDRIGDQIGKAFGLVGRITFWGRPVSNFCSYQRTTVQTVRGCNMSFRATAVQEAGLFDERFIGNAQFEETDYSFRVRALGLKLVFDPIPVVQHLCLPTGGCRSNDRIGWYSDYLYNKARFFRKNMSLCTHAPFFLVHSLIALREGMLRAHSARCFVALLERMKRGYGME